MSRVAADGLILVNEKDGKYFYLESIAKQTLLLKIKISYLFVKKYQF